MKIYNYDQNGYLLGISILNNSDKDPFDDSWLIPGHATDKEPLEEKEGFKVKFVNNNWEYEKILTDEEKKVKGDLPLEEGEIIQENQVVKIEKPSELHSWDGVEWHLDEEKIRLSKLPTQENILNAKIELKALELLSQLELI